MSICKVNFTFRQNLVTMNRTVLPVFVYPYWMRLVGVALILLGIIIFYYRLSSFGIMDLAGFSSPVGMGLILIFFSREKDQDERIAQLKFRSLAAAVPIAAILTLILNYTQNVDQYSVSQDSWFSISAFEFLSVTMIIALFWFQISKRFE